MRHMKRWPMLCAASQSASATAMEHVWLRGACLAANEHLGLLQVHAGVFV
jgi:hypothetical protein